MDAVLVLRWHTNTSSTSLHVRCKHDFCLDVEPFKINARRKAENILRKWPHIEEDRLRESCAIQKFTLIILVKNVNNENEKLFVSSQICRRHAEQLKWHSIKSRAEQTKKREEDKKHWCVACRLLSNEWVLTQFICSSLNMYFHLIKLFSKKVFILMLTTLYTRRYMTLLDVYTISQAKTYTTCTIDGLNSRQYNIYIYTYDLQTRIHSMETMTMKTLRWWRWTF